MTGLDSVDDVGYIFDMDGRLLWWNRALEEVTGYANTELAGMQPEAFFEAEDKRRVTDAFVRATRGESVTVRGPIS
jgi:PAS domain S-box-containing protein